MSKRHTSHRKSSSKSDANSLTNCSDKKSVRKPTRTGSRFNFESPNRSPVRVAKEVPNLSQYFPTKKRSQPSPQTPTRPDPRLSRKILAIDNPITYGDESSSGLICSSEVVIETPTRVKRFKQNHKMPFDMHKSLLSALNAVDQNEHTEQMEVEDNKDFGIENQPNMSNSLDTLSPNPFIEGCSHFSDSLTVRNTNRDFKVQKIENNMTVIKEKEVTKVSEAKTVISKERESYKSHSKELENQSISSEDKSAFEDDFDDDFDQIVSQMQFPIGGSKPVATEPTIPEPIVHIDQALEEDDGFESDGCFEEMLSQIPNDELIHPSDKNSPEIATNAHNDSSRSLASDGFLTLSQIIELIEKG